MADTVCIPPLRAQPQVNRVLPESLSFAEGNELRLQSAPCARFEALYEVQNATEMIFSIILSNCVHALDCQSTIDSFEKKN
jgi:hypothetical protein